MSEQKRYTAHEMREEAKQCKRLGYYVAETMLRQAADADEQNAQLKARIEAVVKECDNQMPDQIFIRMNDENVYVYKRSK